MATTLALEWPALPYAAWKDTRDTLHLWTQVVGKIRLAHTPWINHSWHVALYLTARGLTTSVIPYGARAFQIDFDFIDHVLCVRTSDGQVRQLTLAPMPVAQFYADLLALLTELGLDTRIDPMPNEIADAIPFDRDRVHASYDREYAARFWRILLSAHRVFALFRTRFLGKVSPVHFFWGSFDLAVTRFSGRAAPPLAGSSTPNVAPWVMQEAYSHECSSVGFWPGNGGYGRAAFYSYAYPEPDGFGGAPVAPQDAAYNPDVGQFLIDYEAVRTAASPDEALLAFMQSTYEAAANRLKWDRGALERADR